MTKIRVTRSHVQNKEGLELLRMALWVDGKEHDHVTVVSGQPGRQEFRLGKDSLPGSMEPIPEGYYKLGSLAWVGPSNDFTTVWNSGLGPVVVDIYNAPGNFTKRAELRIHADWNESYAPGTAGCLGVQGQTGDRDFARLKTVIGWMRDFHPQDLEVDYNLGTIVHPKA